MATEKDEKSVYAATWDKYVTEDFPKIQAGPRRTKDDLRSWQVLNTSDEAYVWPGDEWGDAQAVARILETCVFPYLDAAPGLLCELASGGGRITSAVLRKYPQARLECFDISSEFLDQIHRRFSPEIAAGRVGTTLLTSDPQVMYRTIRQRAGQGQVDCIFSFDAMVHVELHSIVLYLATAAATLKPGGLVAMNVADGSREPGFHKLLFNAPGVFRQGGTAGPQFQFASPDIIAMVLERFGFSYEFHECNNRDLFFSALLQDPGAARRSFETAGSTWWFME